MKKLPNSPLIYTDHDGLKYGDLTEKLIGVFYDVYNELGHGFLEAVYAQAFAIALAERSIFFERELAFRCGSMQDKSGIIAQTSSWNGKLWSSLKLCELSMWITKSKC